VHHHDVAVAAGIARYSAMPGALAIVVVGSVARGEERVDSDIDLYLVLTDEEYHARAATSSTSWDDPAPELYDHAYFDVKSITMDRLRAAVESGDEPMRASFEGARPVWAGEPGIAAEVAELIVAIPNPPAEHWTVLAAAFAAQARLHGRYFLAQGEKLGNGLLLHHAATHLAFAIGRAVLAHNRILFAGPKYLEARLERAPSAPADLVGRLRALLDAPSAAAGSALLADFEAFVEWPLPAESTLSRFIADNEEAWLTGVIPPEYR
jgi:hypothetical protein